MYRKMNQDIVMSKRAVKHSNSFLCRARLFLRTEKPLKLLRIQRLYLENCKTGSLRITKKLRRVRVTIVAVEKQQV